MGLFCSYFSQHISIKLRDPLYPFIYSLISPKETMLNIFTKFIKIYGVNSKTKYLVFNISSLFFN